MLSLSSSNNLLDGTSDADSLSINSGVFSMGSSKNASSDDLLGKARCSMPNSAAVPNAPPLPSFSPLSHTGSEKDDPSTWKLADFLHGSMTREAADRLIRQHVQATTGGADLGSSEGTFLVWLRPEKDVEYRTFICEDGSVRVEESRFKSTKGAIQRLRFAAMSTRKRKESLGEVPPSSPDRKQSMSGGEERERKASIFDSNFVLSDSGSRRGSAGSIASNSSDAKPRQQPGDTATLKSLRSLVEPEGAKSPYASLKRGASPSKTINYYLEVDSNLWPDQYVISVVYQGRVTHHLVVRQQTNSPVQPWHFWVNKMTTPCSSLLGVVRYLTEKRTNWPVALTTPIEPLEDVDELMQEAKLFQQCGKHESSFHSVSRAISGLRRKCQYDRRNKAVHEHVLMMALLQRSEVGRASNHTKQALLDAEEAMQLEPGAWQAVSAYAWALKSAGNIDKALEAFHRTIELLPSENFQVKRCKDAIKALEEQKKAGLEQRSAQGMKQIEAVRRHTKAGSMARRKRPTAVLFDDLSDDALWYLLKRREASTQDSTGHKNLSSPSKPEVHAEESLLSRLNGQRLLPHPRWRKTQQQSITSWDQWFSLRTRVPVEHNQASQQQLDMSKMYAWALTLVHIVQTQLGPKHDSLTVHLVTPEPVLAFVALEILALLPEVSNLHLCQILTPEEGAVELSHELLIDDVLPCDDDSMAPQRLRVSRHKGNYSDLIEDHDSPLPKPDISVVLNSRVLPNEAQKADLEDVIDILSDGGTLMAVTHRTRAAVTETKSWMKQMLMTPLDIDTHNPFAALRPRLSTEATDDPTEGCEHAHVVLLQL